MLGLPYRCVSHPKRDSQSREPERSFAKSCLCTVLLIDERIDATLGNPTPRKINKGHVAGRAGRFPIFQLFDSNLN